MTAVAGRHRDAAPAVAAAWWPTALVFLLACLPYAETPWFGFVDYDDPEHVAGHAIVGRGLTARGVAWAFGFGTDPARDGWFNWPLTWLSHMTDASFFGSWAGGHHVVNVLLHAVNAVLVFAVVRRLGYTLPGALLVSAVFAVHPAQVESVAWVSERKTVLCACLMFLAMLAYLRWREARASAGGGAGDRAAVWLLAWNVLGGLALLAKPLAVTLPCVLLLIDAMRLERVRGASLAERLASLARRVPEKLPLVAAVAATCVWTVSAQADAGAVHQLPLATRLAHAVVAYATYLRVFFWPAGLGCFHPHPGMPTGATFTASAAAVLAATAAVTVAMLRGRSLPLFGWLWFLGTLVPTIGVIQVGGNGWSDRYLYLPIVGLALTVAGLAEWAAAAGGERRLNPAGRRAAAAVGTAWIAVLAVVAWRQAVTWRDTGTLAAASVAASPASAEAWNMLAVHQAGTGHVQAAEESFGNAIALAASPVRRADHVANLGRLLLDVGRDADAARVFTAAVEAVPHHGAGRRGLGVALTRLGAADRAEEVFRRLVADDPRDAIAWVGLGNALYQLGRADEAVASYSRALALDPHDAATLVNRAWARLEAGDRPGAASDVTAALGLGQAPAEELLEAVERSTPARPASSAGRARKGDEAGGGPGRESGE
jgi:Flp pilus assembly protein TadD